MTDPTPMTIEAVRARTEAHAAAGAVSTLGRDLLWLLGEYDAVTRRMRERWDLHQKNYKADVAHSVATRADEERDALRAEVGRYEVLVRDVCGLASDATGLDPGDAAEAVAQLRARLAATEAERDRLSAELVGLREAVIEDRHASEAMGLASVEYDMARMGTDLPRANAAVEARNAAHLRLRNAIDAVAAALTSSAALGARVIEEAERRGEERERARETWRDEVLYVRTAQPPYGFGANIPVRTLREALAARDANISAAAREEGRAEERKRIEGGAKGVAVPALEQRDEARRALATVTAERDAWRAAADALTGFDSEPRHLAAAIGKLRSERDEARAKLAAVEEEASHARPSMVRIQRALRGGG